MFALLMLQQAVEAAPEGLETQADTLIDAIVNGKGVVAIIIAVVALGVGIFLKVKKALDAKPK